MTGIDVDLTHFNEYRDTRTFDPNLFFDPATGYNKNPSRRPAESGLRPGARTSSPTATAIRRSWRPA